MTLEIRNYKLVTENRKKKDQKRFLHKTLFTLENSCQQICPLIGQLEAIFSFCKDNNSHWLYRILFSHVFFLNCENKWFVH